MLAAPPAEDVAQASSFDVGTWARGDGDASCLLRCGPLWLVRQLDDGFVADDIRAIIDAPLEDATTGRAFVCMGDGHDAVLGAQALCSRMGAAEHALCLWHLLWPTAMARVTLGIVDDSSGKRVVAAWTLTWPPYDRAAAAVSAADKVALSPGMDTARRLCARCANGAM